MVKGMNSKHIFLGIMVLLAFNIAFAGNIAVFSWEMDGLAEKGFRDEVLNDFPDMRFYSFPCNKNMTLVKTYIEFFRDIPFEMIFVNGIIPAKALSSLNIPMIFYLKTDPVKEGLIADMKLPKSKATGITTKIPIIEQIKALYEIKKFNKIGILKEKKDVDYIKSYDEISRISRFFDFSLLEISVSEILSDDTILEKVDAVYIPYSQIPGVEVLDLINKAGIPSLSENQEYVTNQGALIAIVVDDYRGGRFAGKKGKEILLGKAPESTPVLNIEHFMFVVNLNTASKIQVEIPVKFLIIADKIVR